MCFITDFSPRQINKILSKPPVSHTLTLSLTGRAFHFLDGESAMAAGGLSAEVMEKHKVAFEDCLRDMKKMTSADHEMEDEWKTIWTGNASTAGVKLVISLSLSLFSFFSFSSPLLPPSISSSLIDGSSVFV